MLVFTAVATFFLVIISIVFSSKRWNVLTIACLWPQIWKLPLLKWTSEQVVNMDNYVGLKTDISSLPCNFSAWKTKQVSSHRPSFIRTEQQMIWEPNHWQVWGDDSSCVLRTGLTPQGYKNIEGEGCSPGSRRSWTAQQLCARVCKQRSQT